VFDSFYWSFVTATNLGCGDLRPVNPHRHYGSDVHRHPQRIGHACGFLRAGRP